MIYFIYDKVKNAMKIGYTDSNLKSRISMLQTGSSVKLILITTIDGDIKTEKFLHTYFAHKRTVGEWFDLDDDLWDFITQININKNYVVEIMQQELYAKIKFLESKNEQLIKEQKKVNHKKLTKTKTHEESQKEEYEDALLSLVLKQRDKFCLSDIAKTLNIPKNNHRSFFKTAKKIIESKTSLRYPKKQTRYKNVRSYWWEPLAYE